jgi:DNA-binding NarL/FixJ family response regulator
MTRILIADDHAIVRDGLRRILQSAPGIEVAGEAVSGDEVMLRVREGGFDLLLLDMSMPGKNGIELIKWVKAARPELVLLVLSMHQEEQYAVRAIRAGASGYVTKESASALLVAAIRKVADGGLYISPGVAEQLALTLRPQAADLPHKMLSDREYEVFGLLVTGATVSDIAAGLHLSGKTVSTHKARILEKAMGSVADLVRAMVHKLMTRARASPGQDRPRPQPKQPTLSFSPRLWRAAGAMFHTRCNKSNWRHLWNGLSKTQHSWYTWLRIRRRSVRAWRRPSGESRASSSWARRLRSERRSTAYARPAPAQ